MVVHLVCSIEYILQSNGRISGFGVAVSSGVEVAVEVGSTVGVGDFWASTVAVGSLGMLGIIPTLGISGPPPLEGLIVSEARLGSGGRD
ncbi:MAG TPA: hypothetical protein VJH97_06980 [Candidatus Nanoarchaeia archaeon]|nr:hypothetical protein [Candidatus Nanoarchaeia archaeon]